MLGRFGEIDQPAHPQQLLDRRQVASVLITVVAMAAGLFLEYVAPAGTAPAWVYATLYLIGVALLGGPIVISAIRGLLRGHTNVDELVALALIASVIGGYYFEADIVALLMVLGSLFEQRATLRARRAIEQLLRLTPHEATLVHDDGREEVVPAQQLKSGDRVLVRTAQRVPADGIIETGGANFDQSAVTGESVPVYHDAGHTVFAGTLALDGSATLRVTRTGEDSTVGQIIKIVQDAEHHQSPAMRIADQWARYYTPLILFIAAAAWGGSVLMGADKTWQRAIAVLIVGCPCAIVLATPTAIIAAMGRAAKLGVLIKSGALLERAAQVDTLIFDKTGTLTSGKHQVVAVVPADDLKGIDEVIGLCPAMEHSILRLHAPSPGSPGEGAGAGASSIANRKHVLSAVEESKIENQQDPLPNPPPAYRGREAEDARGRLLALAAAVEHHSNHPFARAIRDHAKSRQVEYAPASDVKEIPGVGVQGRINGQPVLVGRPEFVAQSVRNACAVPGTIIRPIQRYSVIAVEVAGTYAGLILLRDTLRPAAEAVVEELRETGLTNLAVLSGDHRGAVKLVADQLRLDDSYAGLLPADKALQVKALREQGRVVAFVGDGMNDAPALAVADVGIAMGGSGTDLAMETADVVLLNDRIELLATLFDLAKRVRTTIHVNLALGLTLNVTALALASMGVLTPMLGALVHNIGSVFVVSNSARFAAFRVRTSERASQIPTPAPKENAAQSRAA